MRGMNRVKPVKITWARQHRASPTAAERALWTALRGRRLDGFYFRRQVPLLGYIVDFYCARARLVVEADGSYHDTRRRYDARRDAALRSTLGLSILRLPNDLILSSMPSALTAIRVALRPGPQG